MTQFKKRIPWFAAFLFNLSMWGNLAHAQDVRPDPCLDTLGPANSTESAYRVGVCQLVNQARVNYGREPLTLVHEISQVSQNYANQMKRDGFFSHKGPKGSGPGDRLNDGGIEFGWAGENIALGQKNAEEVFHAWWNSKGHRANILNRHFKHLGMGVSSPEGRIIWVQNFVD